MTNQLIVEQIEANYTYRESYTKTCTDIENILINILYRILNILMETPSNLYYFTWNKTQLRFKIL